MLTDYVRHEYQKLRKPYISDRYGYILVSPAANALKTAKERVWLNKNWEPFDTNGIAMSNDGMWRCRIVPDEGCSYEDLAGDTYNVALHKDTVPGGARTIKAEEREYKERLEREGVWGYVLERRVKVYTVPVGASGFMPFITPLQEKREEWEHVDSCYGFDYESVQDDARDAMYYHSSPKGAK